MGEHSRISITKSLVTFVAILTTALAIFLLAVCLNENPFVLQITSVFGYTAWVFYLVFCDSRYWRGYSLRKEEVRQELPRLLSMHVVFLVLLVVVETMALWARPHLPGYWRTEYGSRHDTLFAGVLMLTGLGIGMTQILITRRILGRVAGKNA
jgi:hypothetical protein